MYHESQQPTINGKTLQIVPLVNTSCCWLWLVGGFDELMLCSVDDVFVVGWLVGWLVVCEFRGVSQKYIEVQQEKLKMSI